ncbi:MAG: flagellar basal-body MS-ring/collar protein FliF [Spirochaetes bacterium]|jgi:flagellar M-ring protein FliF|nr:flagellar basal-body MS-ring/collar protein FliF [Spirochaetota bacterium]
MDFLKQMVVQLQEVFSKLNSTKKIIIGAVGALFIISFIALFSISSETPKSVLFAELTSNDFGQVTKKLEELGYNYTTTGTTAIHVDPKDREVIMTRLAQEDMIPKGIPGWQLFDVSKWTETDREIDVKYMRALRGSIQKHIESLRPVEKADVEIAMTNDDLYSSPEATYTAAVTIYLAPGYETIGQKSIKGIMYLVSRAVGSKLKPENVTVTNADGKIISDFDDDFSRAKEEMSLIEQRRKIKERDRVRLLKDIHNGLERIFPDRVQIVSLNLEYNWDAITEDITEYFPVEMVPDDPNTPYSERVVKDSLVVSEKTTDEKFQGHGWNPEGPAGTEANRPPGYKAADDQFAKYEKNEDIKNHKVNEKNTKIIQDPYDIANISVSIAIDGIQDLPKKSDGSYDLDPTKDPVQIPLTPKELKEAEEIVKAAIQYNKVRGDQVAVKNIMFDHSKEWAGIRDEHYRKEQMKRLALAALIGLFALFLGFILFQSIRKEMERRRRIREEQLALEQQRMREAALRAAEEEGVDVELSLEDRARLELQENAMNLAKERPDDVAQLLRTWLAEE